MSGVFFEMVADTSAIYTYVKFCAAVTPKFSHWSVLIIIIK